NPMQPLLPVPDAELSDMRRDAQSRKPSAEGPAQIMQRPMRDCLAAVEPGHPSVEPILGAHVMNLRTIEHVTLALGEPAQDLDRRRREQDRMRFVRLHPPGRDRPQRSIKIKFRPGGTTELGASGAQK